MPRRSRTTLAVSLLAAAGVASTTAASAEAAVSVTSGMEIGESVPGPDVLALDSVARTARSSTASPPRRPSPPSAARSSPAAG